jgi:putative polyhydroxyalkanoate system protein
VERIAAKLAERFGARCHWVNDELHVEHAAVHGVLKVTSAQVSLEAELRFPASLMRGQIEAEIDRLLDRELASS